jgi:hypothetical protein
VLEYLLHPSESKPIRAVAAKASNTHPQLRYASVPELSEDVRRFLDGQAVLAYRESLLEQATRWITQNKTLAWVILTYLVVRSMIFFFTRR